MSFTFLASVAGNDTIPLMSEDTPQQSTASQPSPAAQSGPHPDQSSSSSRPDNDQPEHIVAWTASEFIAHQKDSRWYMAVIGITIVLAAAVRLLTHDNISTVMVVILGIVFCVAGARKPRMLSYAISEDGIEAGKGRRLAEELLVIGEAQSQRDRFAGAKRLPVMHRRLGADRLGVDGARVAVDDVVVDAILGGL